MWIWKLKPLAFNIILFIYDNYISRNIWHANNLILILHQSLIKSFPYHNQHSKSRHIFYKSNKIFYYHRLSQGVGCPAPSCNILFFSVKANFVFDNCLITMIDRLIWSVFLDKFKQLQEIVPWIKTRKKDRSENR